MSEIRGEGRRLILTEYLFRLDSIAAFGMDMKFPRHLPTTPIAIAISASLPTLTYPVGRNIQTRPSTRLSLRTYQSYDCKEVT